MAPAQMSRTINVSPTSPAKKTNIARGAATIRCGAKHGREDHDKFLHERFTKVLGCPNFFDLRGFPHSYLRTPVGRQVRSAILIGIIPGGDLEGLRGNCLQPLLDSLLLGL